LYSTAAQGFFALHCGNVEADLARFFTETVRQSTAITHRKANDDGRLRLMKAAVKL
jgi:hypothetical protein